MKIRYKILITLLIVCASALVLAACSVDGTPYGGFDDDGYTVSVRYEANGGTFAGSSNINLVDVFPQSAFGSQGIKLVAPGSTERGDGQTRSLCERSGYFLAGWYSQRELRYSDSGEPLDEDGIPTSVSGKAQGYQYSGLWDFDNDYLTIEDGKEYSSKEVVLTLYAAWVPNFTYNFYALSDDSEWEQIGSYVFNPTIQSGVIAVPSLNDETGGINYGDFPQVEGKTFTAVYSDSSLETECVGTLSHSGEIDSSRGIATNTVNNYYTTWKDGVWFRISTAAQLFNNAYTYGCYEIDADIDFSNTSWPEAFARGDFSGKFIGNNHSFLNITVTQTDVNYQLRGGLFGSVTSQAVIKDLTFDNVVYKLMAGSRLQGNSFGLFAGVLSADAVIQNVSVSGELQIGNLYPLYSGTDTTYYSGYSIGLLSGNLEVCGITYDISCRAVEVQSGSTISIPCAVEVESDGNVLISKNENI